MDKEKKQVYWSQSLGILIGLSLVGSILYILIKLLPNCNTQRRCIGLLVFLLGSIGILLVLIRGVVKNIKNNVKNTDEDYNFALLSIVIMTIMFEVIYVLQNKCDSDVYLIPAIKIMTLIYVLVGKYLNK